MHDAERLTQEHLSRADKTARRMALSYPHLDRDDIIAAGRLGLVHASQRYVDQGRPFWVYASSYVQGEIRELARRAAPASIPIEEWHGYADDGDPEVRIMIRTMLQHVADVDRQVLVCYYLRGQSQKRIAEQLGISEVRVSKVRRRGLESLRKRYAPAPAI